MSCGRCLRGYKYQLMAEEDLSAMMSREDLMELPPGFRFHPTDEEVITNYLAEKVLRRSFSPRAMGEVDLNKCEPWDLPSKAVMGEKVWYFYCHKDKKYPTGSRTNRATKAGYWKATGKDKEIYREDGKCLVGMKKTLVFYEGRAPKGQKTNWVMHEYRLEGKSSQHLPKAERDEWVVCRVTHKNTQPIKKSPGPDQMITTISPSTEPLYTPTLPPLMDYPYPNYPNTSGPSSSSMAKDMKIGGCGDFTGNSSTTAINHHQLDPYNINTTTPTFHRYPRYVPNPTPSVIPTPSPLHHNSNTGPTGSNLQVTLKAPGATEDATSPLGWQCKEEQYSCHSLVTFSPAISNDRSTGNSSVVPMTQDPEQLASCGSSWDDIEHLLRFFA